MSGGQQGDDKNSMQILWIIFGVFAVCGLIWWGFAPQLKMAFIALKRTELYFLNFVIRYIPFVDDIKIEIGNALYISQHITYVSITAEAAEEISIVSGKYMSVFYILIILFFGYKNYNLNLRVKYRRKHNMLSLREQEQVLWPQIKAVSGINLLDHDLEEGPWAMGQAPLLFCKRNKLIDIEVIPPKEGQMLRGPTFKMIVDKSKALRIFASQLGNMWQGEQALAPYKRAVLAILIGRGCRDSIKAKNLVHTINQSIDNKKLGTLNFEGTSELLKKHMKNKEIQKICRSHAYEYTVFISLLLYARKDGVLPSSDFLWIKPIDRRFWYVLNNVGRQTAVTEAAGSYAHFLAEKGLRRSLSVPYVEEAVRALQLALDDIMYTPDDEERAKLLKEAGIIE